MTDCTFLHGHGLSIGSETTGGVRNVTVKHCTFENTENGLRIKSDVRRGGTVENIAYSDITMSNVNPAITLTCIYQKSSAGDAKAGTEVPPNPELDAPGRIPVFRNIRIANLTATCPKNAGLIQGLPESCISNVLLENVKISAAKSFEIHNAKAVQLKNVSVTVTQGDPFTLENAEVPAWRCENSKLTAVPKFQTLLHHPALTKWRCVLNCCNSANEENYCLCCRRCSPAVYHAGGAGTNWRRSGLEPSARNPVAHCGAGISRA